ncbi:MAG: hypothetical protein ACLS5K_07725 [Streptococcus salivarius]
MCGEIDEEITVPELVKEGTLCPHQDYVYFAFPTKEERAQLDQFEKQKLNFLTKLSSDINFSNTIQSSPALRAKLTMMTYWLILNIFLLPDFLTV